MKRYVFLLYILAIYAVADKADIDQILEVNQSNISLSEESQETLIIYRQKKIHSWLNGKLLLEVEGLKSTMLKKGNKLKRKKKGLSH